MDGQKDTHADARLRARDILTNASETIFQRGATHGSYDLTMLRTAKLWSEYLERTIDPMDVAICMALVKLARIMESRKHDDNWVDACAYFAIAGELAVHDWNALDDF